jgi:hypothetical protein
VASLSAADQALYNQDVSTVESDLANDNFNDAWSTALASSGLYDTQGYAAAMKSQTTDPLLGYLENNVAALAPGKQWTSAETSNFYNAFNQQGAYHGKQIIGQGGGVEALGQDPSGLWGDASAITSGSDAAANVAQAGNTPNVARFVGAKPTQSFLSKYGGDIAALGLTALSFGVAAPALAGALTADGLSTAAAGALAGGITGLGTTAATDAITGKSITAGGLLGGALGGAAGGGLTRLAGGAINNATGLGNTLSTGIAGAGLGAARGALTGGNIGLNALTGGVAGSIQGSGVAGQLKSGLSGATGLSNGASNALVNGGLNYAIGGVTGAAAGALMGGGANTSGTNYLGSGVNSSVLSQGAQGNSGGMASTDSSLASTITGTLPGLLQGAAGIYGSQNAAQTQTNADANAIGTQQSTLGNISNIWGTQQNLGQGAQTALGAALGTNGQPANYSNFYNMPGYQFAVNQGTQAIQRQAASMGSAYTPNTAAAVGQYVTGTASQDYNTYISQLMSAAGLGSTANQGLQTANQATGNNISTLQQNQGQAQASGVTGASNAIGGLFGANGVGTSLIGAAGNYLSGGGSVGSANYGGTNQLATSVNNADYSGVGGLGNFQANITAPSSSGGSYGGSYGGSFDGSYGGGG